MDHVNLLHIEHFHLNVDLSTLNSRLDALMTSHNELTAALQDATAAVATMGTEFSELLTSIAALTQQLQDALANGGALSAPAEAALAALTDEVTRVNAIYTSPETPAP